jgi:hypothetical protein
VGRRGADRVLMGRPDGKRPLGRSWRRWKNNIKMEFQEVRWGGMVFIVLVQDRNRWRALLNAVMNLLVPHNAGNFVTSKGYVSFSRSIRSNILHVFHFWTV